MNQTIISNVVSDLYQFESNGYEKNTPPYSAPHGFQWQKESDEYDHENDVVWEGNWILVPEQSVKQSVNKCCSKFKLTEFECLGCQWKCPNGHMESHFCYQDEGGYDMWLEKYNQELIQCQQKIIADTLSPNYHTCTHETHTSCTNSLCCDFFWHEGECDFISHVDGEHTGYAVRFGNI